MGNIQVITGREQAKRQEIVDLFLTDLELFRIKAAKSFKVFNKTERRMLSRITPKGMHSYQIMAAWDDSLRVIIEKLEQKRRDDSFKKSIVKNLVLNEGETKSKIERIISEREREVVEQFLELIYNNNRRRDRYRKERKYARRLFMTPNSRVATLKEHQVDYMLFREIAYSNKIAVVDSNDWFLKRMITRLQIWRERKNTIKLEDERINFIDNRVASLNMASDGIVREIMEKDWDLVSVIALRNRYEKKIKNLPKEDSKNAVKRLAIFDQETSQFREEQALKIALNSDQASLETTRQITRDVDALLLRIFDLTNIQKNQLVLQIREYRELTEEQDSIRDRRIKREKALKK